jgi:hypothetical protein
MARMSFLIWLAVSISSVGRSEEIYCNHEVEDTHCGSPFFNMVSDGDNWKFMYISNDMLPSFSRFTSGQSFLAIHFEIPKANCSLANDGLERNVPSIQCDSKDQVSVDFQLADSDLVKDLRIWVNSTAFDANVNLADVHLNTVLFSLRLSDGTWTAGSSSSFRAQECQVPSSSHL